MTFKQYVLNESAPTKEYTRVFISLISAMTSARIREANIDSIGSYVNIREAVQFYLTEYCRDDSEFNIYNKDFAALDNDEIAYQTWIISEDFPCFTKLGQMLLRRDVIDVLIKQGPKALYSKLKAIHEINAMAKEPDAIFDGDFMDGLT